MKKYKWNDIGSKTRKVLTVNGNTYEYVYSNKNIHLYLNDDVHVATLYSELFTDNYEDVLLMMIKKIEDEKK